MRDIGVQIGTHEIVVGGQLSPVSLLLHVYNHYTQQSTLALFIPLSGLSVAMTHGDFWGMVDEMVTFFSGKALLVYIYTCAYALWDIL